MMRKLTLLAAAGVGYVLGARAGRERYDEIVRAVDRTRHDPRVQEKARQAADLAAEKAPVVKDTVASAASSASDKVRSATGGSSSGPSAASAETALGDRLDPDRLKADEDTGPRGDLP